MAKNMTVVSVTKSLNNQEISTICEQDSLLIEKLEAISSYINVIKSRVTFFEAKIQEGNETQRSSLSLGVLDITNVNSGCKGKLNALWDAIENLQLKVAGHKALIFSNIARPLLSTETTVHLDSQQLSLPGSGKFIKDIFSNGTQLALVSEQQKKLCYDQETEERSFVNQQYDVLGLMADVEQKKGQISELQEKQLKKLKGKIARTKIARAIINCLLVNFEKDYEQHPELLEIKEKWRPPIQF